MTSESRSCVAEASARTEPRKRRRSGAGRVRSHHAERARDRAHLDGAGARRALPGARGPAAAGAADSDAAAGRGAYARARHHHRAAAVAVSPVVEAGRRQNTRIR